MSEELTMTVSPICHTKDGEKYAFISFSDGDKSAEGKIPDCKIEKNNGFSEEDVALLEMYMKKELKTLKKTAAGLNVFDAFRKEV